MSLMLPLLAAAVEVLVRELLLLAVSAERGTLHRRCHRL
jgi:hypothetical protein